MQQLQRWGLLVVLIVLTGCQPLRLSPVEKHWIDPQGTLDREPGIPYQQATTYHSALKFLGRIINTIGSQTVFQVMPIENSTGGEGLPYDASQIVLSSISEVSGGKLTVVLHEPKYAVQDAVLNTGKEMRPRQRPHVLISGSMAFEQDLTYEDSGIDVDLVLPDANIEGKDVYPNGKLDFDKGKSLSRITVVLRLADYKTLAYIPQMQVVCQILVGELTKGRGWGFYIYGSGFGHSGNIGARQGLHQALKNLVDYSVLRLFSLFYAIPFWKIIDGESASIQESQEIWRQLFLNQDLPHQIGLIQQRLASYSLGPVIVKGTIVNTIPEAETGHFGPVTQAFTLKFLYKHAPDSQLISYAQRGQLSQDEELLVDLLLTLVEYIPAV